MLALDDAYADEHWMRAERVDEATRRRYSAAAQERAARAALRIGSADVTPLPRQPKNTTARGVEPRAA